MSGNEYETNDALAAVRFMLVKATIFVGIPIVASALAAIVMLA
jgi:hypothetical protein